MPEKLSIESDAISFDPDEGGNFTLTMRSAMGRWVTVSREGQGQDPVVDGDPELAQSPAIVNALWLAAVAQQEFNDLVLQKEKVIADIEARLVLDDGLLTPDAQRKMVEDSTKTAVKEYDRKFKELVKQAKEAAKTATGLGDLVDSLDGTGEEGWCSHCLAKTQHKKVSDKSLHVCASCGAEASWVWFRFFYGPVLMGSVR